MEFHQDVHTGQTFPFGMDSSTIDFRMQVQVCNWNTCLLSHTFCLLGLEEILFFNSSLPVELQEKPKNTEEGSLSLLQQIFPPPELNQGLLH